MSVNHQQSLSVAVKAKKPIRSSWPECDRIALANGLKLFGTDFSMIGATVLKHRSYKEIYKRFQREDKLCPEAVNACLQWHIDNKPKLQLGFSTILRAFKIDVEKFDPLNYAGTAPRSDGILPLEHYLLNPPEALEYDGPAMNSLPEPARVQRMLDSQPQ